MDKGYKFKVSLIIPTYLRVKTSDEIIGAEGLSLLKRAIESLNILKSKELKIVTVFCVDTEKWTDEFDAIIRKSIMDIESKFPIFVFTERNMIILKRYLKEKGYEIAERLGVCGYANIRNCCLIIANILDADVAIFIDNDEIIEDKEFLKTASEYLGLEYKGMRVDGKGGFYLSSKGELIEKPSFHWWQVFWNKSSLITKTMKKLLGSEERLVESPIILGGNLVLHRTLFAKVPFDPLIPRGEDIDYLINSKRLGFNILFDGDLKIKHLHPERTLSFKKAELKGDIERFIYEREKVKGSDIHLDPYPGYFLKKALPLRALITIFLLTIDLLLKFRIRDAVDAIGCKNMIFHRYGDVWQEYLKFKRGWERVMDLVALNRAEIISYIK